MRRREAEKYGVSHKMFEMQMRVRWVDTDRLQVVHFSNFFRYFEAAEEEFFRSRGLDFERMHEKYGIALPRVEAICRYRSPARFNDLLRVAIDVKEVAEKTILYEFTVINKDTERLLAEGSVRVAAVDTKTWKAVPVPPEFAIIMKPE
jgi:acyl-CoA thioester hydrolase